jgi:hypothetical protein
MRESEGFAEMRATPPEADVVRAVQIHLPNLLEARIFVSSPQKSVWDPLGPRSDTTGGYEIRRKDWQSVHSIKTPIQRQNWNAKTVYLVRINLLFVAIRPDESIHRRCAHGVSAL